MYVELGKSAASSMSFEPPHEVHNKSDITSLQDMAAFGQEENNDLYSRLEGTHGAIMGYDNVNNTIHHKSDFVHFGTADIKQSQRMNEGWLARAKQAKLIAHQGKLQLQQIHDTHHHIGKEEHELSNSEFSADIGYFLHGGDGIDNEAHSGPATNELSFIGIEGVPNAPFILSPLSYDKAVLYLLIGDSVFLDLTFGYEDQHVRDFICYMAQQNIYLATFNEGTLICGNIGKVTTTVWRSWKSIQHTLLVGNWLIDGFISALMVGSTCGFNWSEVLS